MKEHDVRELFILNLGNLLKDFKIVDEREIVTDSDLTLCLENLLDKFTKDVITDSKDKMIEHYIDEALVKQLLDDGFSICVTD
jgi:hypothetical protein